MSESCPYCGAVLPKQPRANSKCSECKNTIYVRKKRPFFDKDLLTEEEMLVSDEFVGLSTTWNFRATKELYEATRRELSARFGTLASWGDVTWAIYAKYADRFARQPNFEALAIVYACMAAHLHRRHKPFDQCLRESHRYRLMNLQQNGFRQALVNVYSEGCPPCTSLKSQAFKITSDLIKNPPLPPKDCTCKIDKRLDKGYCLCSFYGDAKGMTWRA